MGYFYESILYRYWKSRFGAFSHIFSGYGFLELVLLYYLNLVKLDFFSFVLVREASSYFILAVVAKITCVYEQCVLRNTLKDSCCGVPKLGVSRSRVSKESNPRQL